MFNVDNAIKIVVYKMSGISNRYEDNVIKHITLFRDLTVNIRRDYLCITIWR